MLTPSVHADDKFTQSVDEAIASATGRPAPLRIGQNWSATAHLSPILRAWRTAYPDRPVDVVRVEDRTAGLADGSVDVALTRGPLPDDGYRSTVIDHEPRVAVLPAEHPLAQRASLCLDDLAD
ncbi:MAG: LysR substrate-binding domain-containing protein, partial [Verrucomicrobiales bacterium]